MWGWDPVGPLECSTLTDAGRDSAVCLHSLTVPSCQPARTYAVNRPACIYIGLNVMDIGTAYAPVCWATEQAVH